MESFLLRYMPVLNIMCRLMVPEQYSKVSSCISSCIVSQTIIKKIELVVLERKLSPQSGLEPGYSDSKSTTLTIMLLRILCSLLILFDTILIGSCALSTINMACISVPIRALSMNFDPQLHSIWDHGLWLLKQIHLLKQVLQGDPSILQWKNV